jgi:hypothetical protein
MQQGGVKVDNGSVKDPRSELDTVATEPLMIQVGKRKFTRVKFRT